MLGELLYEGNPQLVELVEYGTKFSDLMAGKPPGPEGARFDFHLVGNVKGKLTGRVKALVTMTVRPDGLSVMEMHESLTTEDGENILLEGSAVSLPGDEPGSIRVKGAFTYHTSSKKYAWANSTIGVLEAGGNLPKGDFTAKVYSWD